MPGYTGQLEAGSDGLDLDLILVAMGNYHNIVSVSFCPF